MFSNGPPHMAEQKQGDQIEPTHCSSVRIRDIALRTCQKRWKIGRSCERGSRISVLVARQDGDDECKKKSRKWRLFTSSFAFFLSVITLCGKNFISGLYEGWLKSSRDICCWWHFLPIGSKHSSTDGRSVCVLTNPSTRTGCDTRSILKRSLTGFNSEFSF